MSSKQPWPNRVGRFLVEAPLDADRTTMFAAHADDGEGALVKMIRRPGHDTDALRSERFLAEAAALRGVNHAGVVKVLDAGVVDDCYYVALAQIDGRSLAQVAASGPVDFGTVLAVGLEVGDTLAHLHSIGITVRDLEPNNVVIDRSGRAVIAGIALSALTRLTAGPGQRVLGVPGFVAPELLLGLSPSPLSDQYAFGRLLLFLAGVLPRIAIDPWKPVRPQIEAAQEVDWTRLPDQPGFADLREFLDRLTKARAAERFPGMDDAVEALVELALEHAPKPPHQLGGDTIPVSAVSPPKRPPAHVPITRSLVVAQDDGLEIKVEDVDSISIRALRDEPEADEDSGRALEQLRRTADRHLSIHGAASGLLDPAALPGESERPEPKTEPVELIDDVPPEDDDDEPAEFIATAPDVAPTKPVAVIGHTPSTPVEPDLRDAEFDEQGTIPPEQRRVSFTVGTDASRDGPPTRAERPPPVAPPVPQAELPTMPPDEPTHRRFAWEMLVIAAVLAFGGVWIARTVVESVAGASVEPDVLPVEVKAPVRFSLGATDRPLSPTDVRRARGHFARARAALADNRVVEAERELGTCIEVADLPECHRTLAALLSLVGDPAAGAHLERYLGSKDADPKLKVRLKRASKR